MKKNITKTFVVGMAFLTTACSDYLEVDKYFEDRMTVEKVFKDRDYSEQWLADTYSHLNGSVQEIANKNWTPQNFADDMFYSDFSEQGEMAGAHYVKFKNATYDENWYNATWDECYKGIRKASIFIHNIDINKDFTPEEILDYKAQARFVRAYYYWVLLKKYGPIPLLPDEGADYTEDYDKLSIPRSTYDECVKFISDEMILAAKDLPLKRDLYAAARPTRGAALATRAKALLYAASPLMNGNKDDYAAKLVDDRGKRLLSEEYDETKWAVAAAAARDVMELNNYSLYVAKRTDKGDLSNPATIIPWDDDEFFDKSWPDGFADIDPFESYRAVFNGTLNITANPELIFTRGQNYLESIEHMVWHQLPVTGGGFNCHGLTQKQCDAYYMNDGQDCPGKDKEIGRGDNSNRETGYVTNEDVTNGRYKPLVEGVSLQYANREPRFYASVAYNGSMWNFASASQGYNRHKVCWYYNGENDGRKNSQNWVMTGIGIKKFVHPTDASYDGGKIQKKVEPTIRYADILLAYAEAINELDGTYEIESWDKSTVYTISRDKAELEKGIHPIRIRAGLPDYHDDIYSDKNLMRAKIKRERQIEFLGESQRYYDLRRWKDAAEEETTPIYGCNTIMGKDNKDLFHTPVLISSLPTVFVEKTYFWPIKLDEFEKNKRLTQNPGWNYKY